MSRCGGALAEVILAMVVLAAGIAAATRAAAVCARALRIVEVEQAGMFAAEAVLDSLLALPAVEPGTVERSGRVLRWSITERDGLPVLELFESTPGARAADVRRYAAVLRPAPAAEVP